MALEVQISAAAFARGFAETIDAVLNDVDVAGSAGRPFVDRLDRAGELVLANGLVMVPVTVYFTSGDDVLAHANEEPSGPSTQQVQTVLRLTPGELTPTDLTWRVQSDAFAETEALDFTFQTPAPTTSLSTMLATPRSVGVLPECFVIAVGSAAQGVSRVPPGQDWCTAIPGIQVDATVTQEARKAGIVMDPTYREENGQPVLDFDTEMDVDLGEDPLPTVRCHAVGTIRLSLAQSADQLSVLALIAAKCTPVDDTLLASLATYFAENANALPINVTRTLPLNTVLPRFTWLDMKGDSTVLSALDDHTLLAGSVSTKPTPSPLGAPRLSRSDWSGFLITVMEGSAHVGGISSAITSASVRLENGGRILRVRDLTAQEAEIKSAPKFQVNFSSHTIEVDASSEEIESREAVVGQIPYRLLVRTSRGSRVVDFGVPTHPERDASGFLTNVTVLPIPAPVQFDPVFESPISDPPDEFMRGSVRISLGPGNDPIVLSPQLIKRMGGL